LLGIGREGEYKERDNAREHEAKVKRHGLGPKTGVPAEPKIMAPPPPIVRRNILIAYGPGGPYPGNLRSNDSSRVASRASFGTPGHIEQPITSRPTMPLRIGDEAPDFTAESTEGTIKFHEWIGNGWAILFSHPKDFTPVCTTELGYMAGLKPEFEKRNTKILGLSIDPVSDHKRWVGDIEETQGHKVNYPLIGDPDLTVAKLYDMIHPNASGAAPRTAADNATIRSVFVVGPDKKIKLMLTYPMSTGRNFDEVLRVLDSMQLTAKHKVATPVNWKQGEDVIIVPSVSNDEAKEKFPGGWKAPKPYLRIVPQPK
jgi:alkyl hydroperoxide reductase subunit AhpC